MFIEDDWQPLSEMFADEECVRYTIGTPQPDWWTWRYLATYLGHWQLRGYGPYAVVEKASGQLIGPIGLWYPGDWPEPEIKWSIRKKFWGQGFAQEAAKAVKAMAAKELKWHRLISQIDVDNKRSIDLAKRIGGIYEKTVPFRNRFANIYAYSLIPEPNYQFVTYKNHIDDNMLYQLAEIYIECFTGPPRYEDWNNEKALAELKKYIDAGADFIVVVNNAHEAMAFAIGMPLINFYNYQELVSNGAKENSYYFNTSCTKTKYRKQGLGLSLHNKRLELGEQKGFNTFCVRVRSDNDTNIHLLNKLGFSEISSYTSTLAGSTAKRLILEKVIKN
jgi:RimJ/RimL family protein N-acetyltransferase